MQKFVFTTKPMFTLLPFLPNKNKFKAKNYAPLSVIKVSLTRSLHNSEGAFVAKKKGAKMREKYFAQTQEK